MRYTGMTADEQRQQVLSQIKNLESQYLTAESNAIINEALGEEGQPMALQQRTQMDRLEKGIAALQAKYADLLKSKKPEIVK